MSQAENVVDTAESRPQTRDRFLLTCMGLMPTKLAQHLLFLLKSYPSLADQWGYHIRPIQYYEPLPDFRAITVDQIRNRRETPAVNFNIPGQLALVRRLAAHYRTELEELAGTPGRDGFDFHNQYFAGLDAAMYYSLIRDLKPRRVVEIGAGYSTRIAGKAISRNRTEYRSHAELICIEPYPEPRLTEGQIEMTLVQKPVENISLDLFTSLDDGDILFIDSSHTVKFRSDVCREILDILPRLKNGVWVHVHDIFFPHDYPDEWLIQKRIAFTEQYLLEAFMAFNCRFVAQAANYWLCLDHLSLVHTLCPPPLLPNGFLGRGSFWLRTET